MNTSMTWLRAWLTAALLSVLGYAALRALAAPYPPLVLYGVLTQFLGVPRVFQVLHELFGLGQGGKTFAFLGVTLAWLGGLTLLGRFVPRALAALLLTLALAPLVGWAAPAYGATFLILATLLSPALRGLEARGDRRLVLGAIGGGAALVVGGGLLNLFRSAVPAAETAALTPGGPLPGGLTPVKDFYYVSKNLEAFDPKLDGEKWRLKVDGLVREELSLSLADLRAMPARTVELTLSCISNPVGGPLMGNAVWTGVPFADVLRRAGMKGGARYVVWRAADDYEESLPLGQALEDDVLLVYEMNGEPLTPKHGFPLRVLIPGRYGMKQPRWITRISLTAQDVPGYWVKRDWSRTAHVVLTSRIDFPVEVSPVVPAGKPTSVRGIAFGGLKPVTKVEVTTDGGRTWQAARLTPPRSKYAWTRWELPWTPSAGSYQVAVRAWSGEELQVERDADALPEGATGWHHFIVNAS
ncbi:molybdopterin-dependent oxidoreductase [Deinococcus pimensis]|uniref:molybdopterin-dependent oxidoreductase n=1 Tax=Deinococcus pimensis TaxID=309888 RepID=UPI0004814EBE|nr:molybdopterin-dependent oxidoreductase [Deinococcus pimensis]